MPSRPAGGMTVEWFDEIGSTMDGARLRAEQGAPHGLAVAAARQSAGRGRDGRHWDSPPGNLYATVILRPELAASRAAELGFVVSLAIAEAVDQVAGPPTTLKWPNDVLRNGAKLCGLLLERLEDGAVLAGIGLNVRHAPADMPYPVTSLAAEGCGLAPAAVLERILSQVEAGLAAWRQTGFAAVLARWLQRGPAPGAPLRVRLPSGTVSGGFAGLGPDGSLLLDTPAGRRIVVAGEVLL